MPIFSTQTSIQALEIYVKEIQRGNEVRYSNKTSRIYKASWTDKLILKIDKKLFDGNLAAHWRTTAQISIIKKFADECTLLEPEMSHTEKSLIGESLFSEWNNSEFDKKNVDDIKDLFLQCVKDSSQNHGNIKKYIENSFNINDCFFKTAIEKDADFEFAFNLSRNANSLKENLGLPEEYIFHLTYYAQRLHQQRKFPIEECVNIIQISDQLVTKNRMNETEALSFAIDLNEALGSENLSFNDISSMARSLFHKDEISEKTKISAALAYYQLKKSGKNHLQSMSIVKSRIHNLEHIAPQLPKGCKAECVHQGAHIRGRIELSPEELVICSKNLSSIRSDPSLEVGKGLPDKFRLMDAQFGKDIRRMNYQFFKNGVATPDVRSLIRNDTKLNIGTTDQEKESWIGSFIDYAGGENAASLLSAFISQTMFGEIRKITASSNSKDFSVQLSGGTDTDNFNFVVDQTEVNKSRKTIVKATQLINPIKMISANLKEDKHQDFQVAPAVFDLISAIGNDQRATPTAFGTKYECEIEFDTEKLQRKIVDFRLKRVIAEFDLVLDQDKVDNHFESISIL